MLDVGHHGVLHLADAALVHRRVLPGQMGELRIDGAAQHFDVALLELFQAMIEGDQLGGADEGEVERVEEQHRILALGHFREGDGLDFVVRQNGGCGEIGGGLANEDGHDELLVR